MDVDAKICYCFHVSRRKLLNYVRQEKPKVPSQLSECGGAGTGCGWCIPFLKQIFEQAVKGGETELERLTPEEYEKRRAEYVRAGKGKPPAGATPLPGENNAGSSEFMPLPGPRQQTQREMPMVVTLTPDLEAVLAEEAKRRGLAPESLAINALRDHFLPSALPVQAQDEWERRLFGAASDCGVSLPNSAVSSEGLYD